MAEFVEQETNKVEYKAIILPNKDKFFYGFGDLSTAIIWAMTTSWLMFFLTDVFKIAALAAGTMLLVMRIYDAFLDPCVGLMVDRTNTRLGKARPYLLWFAVPYGVFGCMLFFTPNLDDTGKLIYACVAYFLVVTIYSLINVPYNSLIVLMTKDQKERTELSRNRNIFAALGFLSVSMVPIFAEMLGSGAGSLEIQRTGYFRIAMIFGIVSIIGFLLVFFNIKEHVRDNERLTTAGEKKHTIIESLRTMFQNGPWLVITVGTVIQTVYQTIFTSVVIYYVKYCLNLPESEASTSLLITMASMIVGILISPAILSRIGFKRGWIYSGIVIAAGAVGLYLSNSIIALFIVSAFSGMASGIPGVAIYAMYGGCGGIWGVEDWCTVRSVDLLNFYISAEIGGRVKRFPDWIVIDIFRLCSQPCTAISYYNKRHFVYLPWADVYLCRDCYRGNIFLQA